MNPEALGALFTGAFLVVMLLAMAVGLVITIFYLLTLQRALQRCAPQNRAMEPGMVWLLLIPCFNLVWHFFVVLNIAKSLGAEFRQRNIAAEPEPGKSLGLALCILQCVSAIPYLGCLTGIGALVCFILYWVKIDGYSKQLAG
jgi:hypothetical protein